MNQEISLSARVLIGSAILGSFFSQDSKEVATAATAILTDQGKPDVMAAIFRMRTGSMPKPEDNYMEDKETLLEYATLKLQVRAFVTQVFDAAQEINREKKRAQFAELRQQLSFTNKPHPCGSVSELATKLGCSKNEVRRLKTEGLLDERLRSMGITP